MKLFSALSLSLALPTVGLSCCAIGFHGAAVKFTGQTNLIVWDAKNKTEHFIRDAHFSSAGAKLAFIAPTPGEPTLSKVDPKVFDLLTSLRPVNPELGGMASDPLETKGVQIVKQQDIAGYHATVLRATDVNDLAKWLSSNSYPIPRFVLDWAGKYIKRGWYLTAFKVNGDATSPLRMTFQTDQPFNPYSVPADNGGKGVLLRLFYVSAGSETPKEGRTKEWLQPLWTASVDDTTRTRMLSDMGLSPNAAPEELRVSYYEDPRFGRPNRDDIFFISSPSERKRLVPLASTIFISCLALFLGFRFYRFTRGSRVIPQ